jgi:hypothetical protein
VFALGVSRNLNRFKLISWEGSSYWLGFLRVILDVYDSASHIRLSASYYESLRNVSSVLRLKRGLIKGELIRLGLFRILQVLGRDALCKELVTIVGWTV